ncbi:TetR family transcriptional regulator [Mycobacterium sp. E802]|uniref:TetR/AcrR family transcriptional regulator n=1 Tax=Mycobacterium sp. E802 TaxID=1834152 RepID=UPI0007FC3F56|nr:TetR/AcrR family transcriptional regulator [Mycobacterium sp. E802]OBG88726.1 TetR family transcriptional regulator [Mycobacterium sp. E802]
MPKRSSPVVDDSATVQPARSQKARRRATEARLLAAGLEELQESPRSELTIRAVATRAGISPANAYKYFSSKSALVAAIYLDLLQQVPPHTDMSDTTKQRVVATMNEMAMAVADKPELAIACAAALVVNEPAVSPYRALIAHEVSHRIRSALGPGWTHGASNTLMLTLFGALIAARFEDLDTTTARLAEAVELILGPAVK